MGEECELRQLMLATGDEEDSPERDEATPPASPRKTRSNESPAKDSNTSTLQKTLTPPSKLSYVNEKTPGSGHRTSEKSTKHTSGRSSLPRLHKQRKADDSNTALRPLQHHSFISDVADVRGMEQALLTLLEDFHTGKLRAFGQDCSMEQMEAIREQQERLARLHFDLGAQQELFAPLSDEGLRAGQENLHRLMGALEQLSLSIERLHSSDQDGQSFSGE